MPALAALAELPPGYSEAAGLIDGIDRCLMVGFSRLGADQQAALARLAQAFAGTPLGEPLAAAVEGIGRGEFRETHFATVAAARAALQGAQYDALRKQVCEALGRPFDPAANEPATPAADGPFAVWGESTRHWLTEIALAGFKQLEASVLLPFTATLENLEAEPKAARHAALLAGLQHELLHSVPVSALPDVPLHRWADLWTRGVVNSFRAPAAQTGTKVSGDFFPLGTEHRSHASFAAYVVSGVLECKDQPPRFVRVSLTTYKVDALRGREVWRSFPAEFKPLLRNIGTRGVKVEGCALLPTGDLMWDGTADDGPKTDPFTKAGERLAPGATTPVVVAPAGAADRHPVHLAEPVYLDGYTVADNTVSLADGATLPLLPTAFPPWAEVADDAVRGSQQMVALLRFDAGRWHLQPLAVQAGGKKPTGSMSGAGAWEAVNAKKKTDTLAILRERASRLLRKKS